MRRRVRVWTAVGVAAAVAVPLLVLSTRQSAEAALHRHPRPGTSASASPSPAPSLPGGAFVHPGALVGTAELDLARSRALAGTQPWKSAYDQMRTSRYASLSWAPRPRATVECGPSSNPDHGCSDEREDAIAAYTDALMWYVTRDGRYAAKSVQIMDAWSATIKEHTNHNAPLQTGWAGSTWPRAAELIRYTSTAWPAASVARFATMLRTVYLPMVVNGTGAHTNGNWELIMMDATASIAVFLDDRAAFTKAVDRWRQRVPAYIYLASDGPTPVPPPGGAVHASRTDLVSYWQGQGTFVDGLAQETCRDFGHTGWGFDAAVHVAETARIQGIDLYGWIRDRIVKGLEFHTRYDLGAAVPSWLCGGKVNRGLGPVLAIAYHEYHDRLGVPMPNTAQELAQRGPMGTDGHFLAWETLTSGSSL